jgi:hypothetical protein
VIKIPDTTLSLSPLSLARWLSARESFILSLSPSPLRCCCKASRAPHRQNSFFLSMAFSNGIIDLDSEVYGVCGVKALPHQPAARHGGPSFLHIITLAVTVTSSSHSLSHPVTSSQSQLSHHHTRCHIITRTRALRALSRFRNTKAFETRK